MKVRIVERAGRSRLLALTFLAASLSGLTVDAANATVPTLSVAENPNFDRLVKAAEAFDGGDCETALAELLPLIDGGQGATLPPDLSAAGYEIAVRCEIEADAMDQAYAHALEATRLEESSDYLWAMRLALAVDARHIDGFVSTLEQMSQVRKAALNSMRLQWMWQVDRMLKEESDPALRRRFVKVLASDAYQPDEAYGPFDPFRVDHALNLAEAGDRDAARTTLASVQDPSVLMRASVDPRLRALVPAASDYRALGEKMLAQHRSAIAKHPDALAPVNLAAADLRLLGRPQEALDLLKSVAGKTDDLDAFADRDDQLNWWWDGIARSHAALGQYEEAAAAYRRGASLDEGGALNVSQIVNLGWMQIDFGRPEDALKTLAAFDDPKRKGSPFGEMQVRLARGCARALAGRPAEAAADLAYITAHDKDAPGARTILLLCMNDMDGAASALVERLRDPERRVDALLLLSEYDEPPTPSASQVLNSRLEALKARDDVKAAAETAGGTRRFNVQPPEM